ncbi:MAG TPA: glycosyltransferase family 39 protein [Opitutaceae bacterium]
MSQEAPPKPLKEPSLAREFFLFLVVFGILYGFRLGSAPLVNPDEGRYAEIPREMVSSGDWVTPRLDGVPYFEKPPLMYWMVAGLEETLGRSEWSVRSAPALLAVLGILCACAAARRLYGPPAGFWSGFVLGTFALYAGLAHLLGLDLAVTVFMSAALFCFIAAVQDPPGRRRRLLFWGMYAAAALATMTKGLIGFLIPGAVMFLWLLLVGEWRRLRPFYLASGLVLFLAIALPWHLLMAQRNPGWAHFYLVYEHFQRFSDKGHGRFQPFYYFIPVLILGMFPWTGFLWPALRSALAGGWARRKENSEAWFLAIWAAFIFLFFSKSQSKLIPYILPVFPPLAVLIGRWLAGVVRLPDGFARMKVGLRGFGFLCGLLAAAVCIAVLKPGLIRDPAAALALRPYALILAAVLCVGGLRALVPRGRSGSATGAVIVMTLVLCVLLGTTLFVLPEIDTRSTKDVALVEKAMVRPGDRVYAYHAFFHDFTYYTGSTIGLVKYQDELELQFLDPAERAARFIGDDEFRRQWGGKGRVFAVARTRDAAELFGDPGFRYYVIMRGKHAYLFSNQP